MYILSDMSFVILETENNEVIEEVESKRLEREC